MYEVMGKLPEALQAFQDRLVVAKKLSESDPGNARWQIGLGAAYLELGGLYMVTGKLPEALQATQESVVVVKKLIERDPNNADPNSTGWQRSLGVACTRLGDVFMVMGKLPEALRAFQDSLVIAKKLTEGGPSNTDWLNGLAAAYAGLGAVYKAMGKLPEALQAYEDRFAIIRRLVQLAGC